MQLPHLLPAAGRRRGAAQGRPPPGAVLPLPLPDQRAIILSGPGA
ncbi:hypothetical protein EI555_018375 [Monodon monoceros]|uniref:Uncharacterized protein n=1 Tax=Monodon monoceros TaxID=40151 RepID=A0A4U1FUB8_MONMO|nr:hypothetical protein EI555_018375 [Monodon monoceros]